MLDDYTLYSKNGETFLILIKKHFIDYYRD